jgi:hypothetical protein
VEVLRRTSNNYGAKHRVKRLSRHLEKVPAAEPSVTPRLAYRPSKLSQRLSDETVAAILAAYQAGATTREVGERFSLAHSSVNKLLKEHGITARRRSPNPDEVKRAVQLYEAGLSAPGHRRAPRLWREHDHPGAGDKASVMMRPKFRRVAQAALCSEARLSRATPDREP